MKIKHKALVSGEWWLHVGWCQTKEPVQVHQRSGSKRQQDASASQFLDPDVCCQEAGHEEEAVD